METTAIARAIAAKNTTFNFLASLINGNLPIRNSFARPLSSFNFLASLINGNIFFLDGAKLASFDF